MNTVCTNACTLLQRRFVVTVTSTSFRKINYAFLISSNQKNTYTTSLITPSLLFSTSERNNLNYTFKNILNSRSFSEKPAAKYCTSDLEYIKSLFSEPKMILNNYYAVVRQELKNPAFALNIQFKVTHRKGNVNSWACIYKIKWPDEQIFHGHALTKNKAASDAAAKTLLWLYNQKKINDQGQPILYDKEKEKKIRSKFVNINLSEECVNKMKEMCNIYNNEILPNLSKYNNKYDSNNNYNIQDLNCVSIRNQVMSANLNRYMINSKVNLPIETHKDTFINLLHKNQLLIIQGEPGCGKSTMIPQYILENWVKENGREPVKIIVTEPRRIAAISLARHVASERNERLGDVVGYQVRLSNNFNNKTGRILYCTTGILVRQLQSDPNLTNCTHIIVDEVHERDLHTDLLLCFLQKIHTINPEIKVILMSATIDTDVFSKYFNGAPVLKIPGFTYPVKAYFLEDISLALQYNKYPAVNFDNVVNVVTWIHEMKPEGAILCFLPGWDDIVRCQKLLSGSLKNAVVLTLHSQLPESEQLKIFHHSPPGIRKIILATNLAETSVTIDDVVYVVDTGISKDTQYDIKNDVISMDKFWISKSSVHQRRGRAGRVQPGECYHLFSKLQYREMSDFSIPGIWKVPLTKTVLDVKVMNNNIDTVEFFQQLPSPPDEMAVHKAVNDLKDLELLDADNNVTPLGKVISQFQMTPKLAKSIVNSVIYKCVTPIVDIITLFETNNNLFSKTLDDKASIRKSKNEFNEASDHLAMMLLYEQWDYYINMREYNHAKSLCNKNFIIENRMYSIQKLRDINFGYIKNYLRNEDEVCDTFSDNDELIKAILYSGINSLLYCRKWSITKGRLKEKNVLLTQSGHQASLNQDSVNYKKDKYPSEFLIYVNETKSEVRKSMMIRETSIINPLTVLLFKNGYLEHFPTRPNSDMNITDPVLIKFYKTCFQFMCSKSHCYLIEELRTVLRNMEKYYVQKLINQDNTQDIVDKEWNKIINLLKDIL